MANLLLLSSRLVIKIIYIYKLFISPYLGHHCRFSPTCSQYSIEVIKKFGLLKGILLVAIRILKCNPLVKINTDSVLPKDY